MDKVRNSLGVSMYLHGRSLCLRHNLSFTHIKRTALVVFLIQSSNNYVFCLVAAYGSFCGGSIWLLVGQEHWRLLSRSHSPLGCLGCRTAAVTTWSWVTDQAGSLSHSWLPPRTLLGDAGKSRFSSPKLMSVVLLSKLPPS